MFISVFVVIVSGVRSSQELLWRDACRDKRVGWGRSTWECSGEAQSTIRVDRECRIGSHQCPTAEAGGREEECHLLVLLLSEKSPASLVYFLRLVNKFPSPISQALFKLLCLQLNYLECSLFRSGNSRFLLPSGSSEVKPANFKGPGVKSCWFLKGDVKGTSPLNVGPQF